MPYVPGGIRIEVRRPTQRQQLEHRHTLKAPPLLRQGPQHPAGLSFAVRQLRAMFVRSHVNSARAAPASDQEADSDNLGTGL
jgi:hypothetical protein